MTKKTVVVKGGGQNLYYINDTGGTFFVRKGSVWGSGTDIGKARSMADALAIIKSHSGKDIESID